MQAFTRVRGRAAVLDRADVDTDQIIPAQHLKRIERAGFGDFAFEAWRGQPGFFLGEGPLLDTPFLFAGPNFGCGSSREHAPWALADLGLRAILSPGFADIFRGNCERIGLLPITLSDAVWRELVHGVQASPEVELDVDLTRGTIESSAAPGRAWSFRVSLEVTENFTRGLDFIDRSLTRLSSIEHHESQRPLHRPRTR